MYTREEAPKAGYLVETLKLLAGKSVSSNKSGAILHIPVKNLHQNISGARAKTLRQKYLALPPKISAKHIWCSCQKYLEPPPKISAKSIWGSRQKSPPKIFGVPAKNIWGSRQKYFGFKPKKNAKKKPSVAKSIPRACHKPVKQGLVEGTLAHSESSKIRFSSVGFVSTVWA